jgi:hypothetical protein
MQLTEAGRRRLTRLLVAIIIINALLTGYLLRTVADQQRRIQSLERNDSVKRSVDTPNTKVDGLKNRIQGLFH